MSLRLPSTVGRGTVTDTPCVLFASELVAAYPKAKIILTVRDSPEQWCKSVSNTILGFVHVTLNPTWNPLLYAFRTLQTPAPIMTVFARIFPNQPFNALNAVRTEEGPKRYHEHNDLVRELASVLTGGKVKRTDRFLEFNVKEGWGPLCSFLEKEEPEALFPCVNDTPELRNRFRILYVLMFVGAVGNALKYCLPIFVVAAAILWIRPRI